MTEEKARCIFMDTLMDTLGSCEFWGVSGQEAERALAYIAGAFNMTRNVVEEIRSAEVSKWDGMKITETQLQTVGAGSSEKAE